MAPRTKSVDGITKESTQAMIDRTLEAYPEKGKKKRAPHLAPNDQASGGACVKSNRKTVPGVMSARGCAYAGAKGVVWGPIRDMVHVSHGPVGCGWYSWGTRRNLMSGMNGVSSFAMQFTSDFQEKDIVYGGDKKLAVLLREAKELFPLAKGISVLSECPVGLIGDDINAVAKQMSKELDLPVIPCNCEGFRGVSQSLGHHISNDTIRDYIIETREFSEPETPYDIALIGEYNIGGDAWSTKPLLEECGFNVKAVWTGDGQMEHIAATHKVKLNVIHCYRSMNYMCKVMEEKYGVPWIELNFFGPTKIKESLRKLAERFDDRIKENVEKVIAKYDPHDAEGDRRGPAAPRGQEGHAVRRRPAPAPHRRRVRGPRHGRRRLRLRVRPLGRLRPDRPRDARCDRHLRRRLRVRARAVRPRAEAGPRRLGHQGEVHVPEDGVAVPADAQLGLLRPVPRVQGIPRSSPGTSTWRSTARRGGS